MTARESLEGRLEEVPDSRMATTTRVLATVFVLACVAFWLFAFSPWARDIFTAPDQLQSDELVAQLDMVCESSRTELFALPQARDSETPAARADTLVLANSILRDMRQDLAAIPIADAEDQRYVRLWLADWDIYLDDRDTHVDRLRDEGDVRFFNTVDNGVFVHERMDGFARVNDLTNCETPGDV